MSNEKQAKMLARVRALLAKAESTDEAGEANVFRAKADELMTAYAIEEWQLAEEGSEGREPERRDIDFSWYSTDNPANTGLYHLMRRVYSHARCVPMASYIDWDGGKMPIVGLPSDLDYADMLFTHLMIDMLRQVDPDPDPKAGYLPNLRKLKEAGMSWPEIERKMSLSGASLPPEVEALADAKKREAKMTRDYRAWCRREGIEQSYNNHKTWRRSFSEGYAAEVARRLREMRKAQADSAPASGPGSRMELVLRDIEKVVETAAEAMFAGQRRTASSVSRSLKTNYAAMGEGASAGRKARIANKGGQRLGARKELPR